MFFVVAVFEKLTLYQKALIQRVLARRDSNNFRSIHHICLLPGGHVFKSCHQFPRLFTRN